ncbi:MAG: hypothetical protein GY764_11060 [Halieaceae bacterium]|nr:hypothetical protein [Halieaceae bacterium]
MSVAGAKWIRLAIDWKTVEPTDGADYDWSYYDTILGDMDSDGYEVIISLLNYPDWAISVDGHACGPVPAIHLSRDSAGEQRIAKGGWSGFAREGQSPHLSE